MCSFLGSCEVFVNPFAAVGLLTSYLGMHKLVAVCPYDEYTRHELAVTLSAAHAVAEISLLVGTWYAVA